MNIQEAIAMANEIFGSHYFSQQQPHSFSRRRAPWASGREPEGPRQAARLTEAEVEKIANNAKEDQAAVDGVIKRDQEMTAKTTPATRAYVADVLAAAGTSTLLDRPLFWLIAGNENVTIYKERWPGRRDGDNFILPADRPAMLSALKAWSRRTTTHEEPRSRLRGAARRVVHPDRVGRRLAVLFASLALLPIEVTP